jgi:lysyl-tRNA synthetase class 2
MPSPPFWHRDYHARRRPALAVRARLKQAIRAHFERQDFWEVETALVQASPGNETHLHAFSATWRDLAGLEHQAYLHTSPEFAMKKLLAAGEKRILQFAPVFRAREASPLHAPEFVMLEWYRTHEPYDALMADCADLLRLAAETGGRPVARFRDRSCDLHAAPERLSVVEAFARHAGIALDPCLDDFAVFAVEARRIGVRVAPDDRWSDLFSRILSERIEPKLGSGRATILDRYPISEAALAQPCADDPRFAERFELYVCGIELCNAFGELTDVQEQRARFEADMAEKLRLYGESYPLDEDFLAALSAMPPASGAALGFDRLAMLAAGAETVNAVIVTPWRSEAAP